MADKQWTDLDTWMHDNSDERIFRVWRYKKVFTPLEQEKKYIDQSCYESDIAQFMWLDEVIEMGGGRFMFGFRDAEWAMQYAHGELDTPAPIEYFMDGEFVMQYFPSDFQRLLDELGYANNGSDDGEDGTDDGE